jgi:hypothetical protein
MTPEEKLKRLLDIFDPSTLTKSDFVESFKKLTEFVKQIETKNIQEFKDIRDVLTKFSDKLKEDNGNEVGNLKSEVNQLVENQLNKLMKEHEAKMMAVDERMSEVKDGADADSTIIAENATTTAIERLKPLFVAKDTINEELPKYGKEIRDALELLQGDDELQSIQDLRKEIEDLKTRKIGSVGGGLMRGVADKLYAPIGTTGGSMSILTATGAVDDSNVTFTFVSEPTLVVVNGVTYRHGHGCSIATTTVTLDNAVGINGDIYGLG